jgi:hypothetical protein
VRPSFVALVWLGIVIGVSFMATPIKFAAPSLDLPTALEVGRVTFRLLTRVEWVLAIVLVAFTWGAGRKLPWSAYVVIGIVVAEVAWLLPGLAARTDAIRAGGSPPASILHDLFIAAETAKCLALGHTAFALARAERGGATSSACAEA